MTSRAAASFPIIQALPAAVTDSLEPDSRPQFLSEADCRDIATRITRLARAEKPTLIWIHSTWRGNVRWARNLINTSGEVRQNYLNISTYTNQPLGEWISWLTSNAITDAALVAAVRQEERLHWGAKSFHQDIVTHMQSEPLPAALPHMFSEATYQLDADHRAETAIQLAQSSAEAGMLSAGYISVSAHSMALMTSWGFSRYFQYTWAQYSVTVRDPKGTGSGWAGMDGHDWSAINGTKLTATALDKCLTSRNPVAIEPGRYTTILEPQAVCDFVSSLIGWFDRPGEEMHKEEPFNKLASARGELDSCPYLPSIHAVAKLGERVVDERLTFSADPMDPALAFPPFNTSDELTAVQGFTTVYHPITWIKNGVLQALSYDRWYAACLMGTGHGIGSDGAFRIDVSGTLSSIEEMIATTKRGLIVTRFSMLGSLHSSSLLQRGYTRDGLWLIENGKISKPVKNMVMTESILFALNNIDQLGTPQRAFNPPKESWDRPDDLPAPVIVPPLKIRDFSFTALVDAI